jgi:hypothetical protein
MLKSAFVAATVLASMTTAASAQLGYTVSATGTVSQVYASTSTSNGAIKVGDPFSATISFDTAAVVSNLTDTNGDQSGVFAVPLIYTFSAGQFAISGTYSNFDLVIFNDHNFSSAFTGDSVGFTFQGPLSTNTPFTFSAPGAYTSFNLSGYDTTSATLPDVNLSEVTQLDEFPTKYAQLGFTNSTFTDSAFINATINSFVVSQFGAVPEPATWAMMILGMGVIGFMMRRRKATTRFSYAA